MSRVGNRRRATRLAVAAATVLCILAVVRPGPFFATGTGRAEGSAQQGFTAADLSRFMVKPSACREASGYTRRRPIRRPA